jgi:hypothetical protein
MTQDILFRPEDTGEIVRERPPWVPADDPTRFIPVSPLPRPESTAVIYLQPDLATAPTLPRREGIVMPELPRLPAADLNATEQITLLGALGGEQPRVRRSVPAAQLLSGRPEWTGPKHRRPSWLARLFGGAR